MNIISHRVNDLSESETLAMSRISRELAAKGHKVVNLSIGQPDFPTPDYIKDAAKTAIDQNVSYYTPVSGLPDLREAISLKFKRDNNLDYSCDQIVVSCGGKQAIANVILCLINPGDEVIVPSPFWVSYKELIKLAGGRAVYIPATVEQDFKITPEQLRAAITPKTKLMMINSPCNPTGSVYHKQELAALAEVLADFPHVFILSDEVYELINFVGKHESIGQFHSIKDRVITINAVSKGFSMTGWRLGYMGAPKEIAKACDKLQSQITTCAASISQKAAVTALHADPAASRDLQVMVKAFRERRDLVYQLLQEIPGLVTNRPDGAFYFFVDVSSFFGKTDGETVIRNADDLAMLILNKYYVALVSGTAFGDPSCIRLSYATSKELLVEGIGRIRNALGKFH